MEHDWENGWPKNPTRRDEREKCWDDKNSFTLLVLELSSVLYFPNISVCAQPQKQLSRKIVFEKSVSTAHRNVWLACDIDQGGLALFLRSSFRYILYYLLKYF